MFRLMSKLSFPEDKEDATADCGEMLDQPKNSAKRGDDMRARERSIGNPQLLGEASSSLK